MSTEENKAIERRTIEEMFNKQNIALAEELASTNYVLHVPGGQEFKGVEGFKQYGTMLITAFPDCHIAIEDIVAEGDMAACRMKIQGTHKGDWLGIPPTGKKFTITSILITRFANGKKAETWLLSDESALMQQLGLMPPQG